MSEVPKRIHLLGEGRYEEATGSGTITPGMLLKLTTSGEVKPHDIVGDFIEAAFALEDALQGHTIDDDYADGDLVCYILAKKGDVVYALLEAGGAAVIGDPLTSNGDGFLKVSSDSSDDIVAIALETVDNTESLSASTGGHIRCRVL